MVSSSKTPTGLERVLQKRRTRRALLDAANRVTERGDKPRMTAIAQEAEVSRATIYRYFPSEEALLVEAALHRSVPDLESVQQKTHTPGELAVEVVKLFYDFAADNERPFRHFLRAVVENSDDDIEQAARGGRRVEALTLALGTADSSLVRSENLRCALAALTGIESLIVMKDVCGLSTERGREVVTWAAEALVRAALTTQESSE